MVFPFALQNSMTFYDFRVMVRPRCPCLILHFGGLYPYAPLITVSSQSSFFHPMLIMILSAEQYLQSPLQLEHACQLLLDSELFAFHSERMCELAIDDVQSVCEAMAMLVPCISHMFVEDKSSRTIYFV